MVTDFSPELIDTFLSRYVYCEVLLTFLTSLKLWQLLTFPWIVLPLKENMYFCVSVLLVSFVVVQSLSRDSLQPHGLQHTKLLCSPPSPRVCSDS